jgi:hypothetical protein
VLLCWKHIISAQRSVYPHYKLLSLCDVTINMTRIWSMITESWWPILKYEFSRRVSIIGKPGIEFCCIWSSVAESNWIFWPDFQKKQHFHFWTSSSLCLSLRFGVKSTFWVMQYLVVIGSCWRSCFTFHVTNCKIYVISQYFKYF